MKKENASKQQAVTCSQSYAPSACAVAIASAVILLATCCVIFAVSNAVVAAEQSGFDFGYNNKICKTQVDRSL